MVMMICSSTTLYQRRKPTQPKKDNPALYIWWWWAHSSPQQSFTRYRLLALHAVCMEGLSMECTVVGGMQTSGSTQRAWFETAYK